MANQDFPNAVPNPSYSSRKQNRPNVRQIQFGSGYSQRATFGINQNPVIYNLTFNCTLGQADVLELYLNDRGGVEHFTYTVPEEDETRHYICPEWTRTNTTIGRASVDVVFVEVFEP